MLDDILAKKLAQLEENNLLRTIRETTPQNGVNVVRDSKELISFCDNDYLGLAGGEIAIEASISGAFAYGSGAKSSRLISGNHPLYTQCEQLLCEIKNTQAACIFGSGYLANVGTIPALMGKNDLIVADKLVHSCILDGITLSKATLKRFAHNDMHSARNLLEKHRANHQNCLLITESVFSMDGDLAPLAELRSLCDEFDCWLMVDDAHGLGVIKNTTEIDIQMGTLSKAVGSYGGYVCGSETLIAYLKTTAKSLIYSTALPPSVVSASIAGLEYIKSSPRAGDELIAKATLLTDILGLPKAQSAIVPVIIGNTQEALSAASILEENGFLVSAIRPPTVPEGTARLRVTFSLLHKDDDIRKLAHLIKENIILNKVAA